MSSRRAIAANIDLLIERAQAHGLAIEAVEITVDGTPRILTRRPTSGVPVNDDVNWVDLAGHATDHRRA